MTMKKFCLTLMLCLVAVAATRAQSFIITKSADTLRVYDVEIGYTSVYFKSSRDKEAPLERLSKTKIDHLILVDGQQFTFEGRTPVKEENKTYSVLLRSNRDLEKQEKEKKNKKENDWSFFKKQSGLCIEYAKLHGFNNDRSITSSGNYNRDRCFAKDDDYTMSTLNVVCKLPIIEFGFLIGAHAEDMDEDGQQTSGVFEHHNLQYLRLGLHYTQWIRRFLFFDLSSGLQFNHYRSGNGETHHFNGYSSFRIGGMHPRISDRLDVVLGPSVMLFENTRDVYGRGSFNIGLIVKF